MSEYKFCDMRYGDYIEVCKEVDSLKQQLADANVVIEFYGDEKQWNHTNDKLVREFDKISESDMGDIYELEMFGGKRARLYLDKFGITKCDNRKDKQ